jgi:hypothetical protein
MSTKEDPLGFSARAGSRTVWLNRENMLEACDNWYDAFRDHREHSGDRLHADDRRTWDISWAAAIAAFTYMMEGRVAP